MAGVEQAGHAGHGGVQGELAHAALQIQRRRGRHQQCGGQCRLGQGNARSPLARCATAANGVVFVVVGVVIWHHGVAVVITAVHKYADQGFVVIGITHHGIERGRLPYAG